VSSRFIVTRSFLSYNVALEEKVNVRDDETKILAPVLDFEDDGGME